MDDLDYGVLVNRDNLQQNDYVPRKMYIVDENENNFHKYKD